MFHSGKLRLSYCYTSIAAAWTLISYNGVAGTTQSAIRVQLPADIYALISDSNLRGLSRLDHHCVALIDVLRHRPVTPSCPITKTRASCRPSRQAPIKPPRTQARTTACGPRLSLYSVPCWRWCQTAPLALSRWSPARCSCLAVVYAKASRKLKSKSS